MNEILLPVLNNQSEMFTKRSGGKPLGSALFETKVVRSDEYLLMAKVMTDAGDSLEVAAAQISFIDDCMAMRKTVEVVGRVKGLRYTQSGALRKGFKFGDFISNRLDQLMDELKSIEEDTDEGN